MKENELAVINDLYLRLNALLCDNGTMENAEKKYGFYLIKIKDNNFKSGFHYAVRYKDPETNRWIIKKSTGTDNEELAKNFAIQNREKIIAEYKEHKETIHKKNDGKEFYKMLNDYYQIESKYLIDDRANNRRDITPKQRKNSIGFIKRYLIPYLKQEKILTIKDINRSVYSGLKIYLQKQSITTKTINNYLNGFNRILQYHERNELIPKLPYYKGTGIIRNNLQEKKEYAVLPTEYLKGIFNYIKEKEKEKNVFFSHALSLLGLTTGMRDSEIARIKFNDFIRVENTCILKVHNHKTEYYNINEKEKYRKIPLHPLVVNFLDFYIKAIFKNKKIKNEDYLFGVPKLNKETGTTDGYIHQSKFRKAIIYLYWRIKIKEKFKETQDTEKSYNRLV